MLGKDGEKLNFLMVYFKVYCKVDVKKEYNILIFFFSIESETRIRCTYKIRLIITRIFSMSR